MCERRPSAARDVRPRRPVRVPAGGAGAAAGHRPRPLHLAHRALGADATLLLYTDGLVERRHEDIDASLARLTRIHAGTAPADLIGQVLARVAPDDPEDDIALLAARPTRQRSA
ncbi:SpoIIE family protein phosphatase [Streptomyces cellulosae]